MCRVCPVEIQAFSGSWCFDEMGVCPLPVLLQAALPVAREFASLLSQPAFPRSGWASGDSAAPFLCGPSHRAARHLCVAMTSVGNMPVLSCCGSVSSASGCERGCLGSVP